MMTASRTPPTPNPILTSLRIVGILSTTGLSEGDQPSMKCNFKSRDEPALRLSPCPLHPRAAGQRRLGCLLDALVSEQKDRRRDRNGRISAHQYANQQYESKAVYALAAQEIHDRNRD